jgi:hypothetical protein
VRPRRPVVRLELDHRPNDNAHCSQSLFERLELLAKGRLDAVARLVVAPQFVTERLDHVIRGHADVRGPFLDHLECGVEHTHHRAELPVFPVIETTQAIKVPEKFVRSVDQMNDHAAPFPSLRREPRDSLLRRRDALAQRIETAAWSGGSTGAALALDGVATVVGYVSRGFAATLAHARQQAGRSFAAR